ncbi:hypothetical protein [Streptomyces sp. NPDC058297]|uniref:hypothetical protein n=1 Tax=Streptomyces sp. NPDC058297 TaxID=3346433 RepID=UPI0036E06109
MDTQTDQTTTPAPQQPQHTHHYILTLQSQDRPGSYHVATFNAAVTPPAGWTRADFYKGLYNELTAAHHMAGAFTLFFSLEPNQL